MESVKFHQIWRQGVTKFTSEALKSAAKQSERCHIVPLRLRRAIKKYLREEIEVMPRISGKKSMLICFLHITCQLCHIQSIAKARRATYEEKSVEVIRIIQPNKGSEFYASNLHIQGAFWKILSSLLNVRSGGKSKAPMDLFISEDEDTSSFDSDVTETDAITENDDWEEEGEEKAHADLGGGWGRIIYSPLRRGKRIETNVCRSINQERTEGSFDRIVITKSKNPTFVPILEREVVTLVMQRIRLGKWLKKQERGEKLLCTCESRVPFFIVKREICE